MAAAPVAVRALPPGAGASDVTPLRGLGLIHQPGFMGGIPIIQQSYVMGLGFM